LGALGSLAVMWAGIAGGQHLNFEPARDLMFACVFCTLAIAGGGRLTLAASPSRCPGNRPASVVSYETASDGFFGFP